FWPTPAVPTVGTWAGPKPVRATSPSRGRRPAPARGTSGTPPADDADAAEVVVPSRPAPDLESPSLEPGERSLVHARFCVDDIGSGVEACAFDGSVRREAFVENAGDDAEKRGPETCSSRSA